MERLVSSDFIDSACEFQHLSRVDSTASATKWQNMTTDNIDDVNFRSSCALLIPVACFDADEHFAVSVSSTSIVSASNAHSINYSASL